MNLEDYSSFCPKKYFAEYYQNLGRENLFLLKFFHDVYSEIPSGSRILEFGGGPAVYQVLSAARRAKEIVFADYLDCNRIEVQNWLNGEENSLNWDQYIQVVLALGGSALDDKSRRNFKDEITSKVTEIIECNAYLPNMLVNRTDNKFDVVSSNFCLECINGDEKTFIEFIEKVSGLVEKKGFLILSLLKNSRFYKIGDLSFPSFPVDEYYIKSLLSSLGYSGIDISFCPAEHKQGYDGIISLSCKKS